MKRGFRIHPARPGTKRPNWKDWPEKATTDEDIIRDWMKKQPKANLCLATGELSNVLCADVDTKDGQNGPAEFEAFLDMSIEEIDCPKQRTPSGGWQLFFSYPSGNDAGIVSKSHVSGLAIDVRANGGQCLLPPSRTESGQYRWEDDVEEYDALPACPPELLDLLRDPGRSAGAGGKSLSEIADTNGYTLDNHPGADAGFRNGLLLVLVGKWLSDPPGCGLGGSGAACVGLEQPMYTT